MLVVEQTFFYLFIKIGDVSGWGANRIILGPSIAQSSSSNSSIFSWPYVRILSHMIALYCSEEDTSQIDSRLLLWRFIKPLVYELIPEYLLKLKFL